VNTSVDIKLILLLGAYRKLRHLAKVNNLGFVVNEC